MPYPAQAGIADFFMKKTKGQPGFTLLELLVVMGITILLGAAIVEFFLSSLRAGQVVLDKLGDQQEARTMVGHLVSELQVATISSVGSYPLVKASSTELIFYSNVDTDAWAERVRYFVTGTTFMRGVLKPAGDPLLYTASNEVLTAVAHNVAPTSSPIFYYYDDQYSGGNGASLPIPVEVTKVRVVRIKLVVDRDLGASSAPLAVEGLAQIRNLKAN